MKRVERYLEIIYEDRITDEFDHVLLVIGDEGVGKSTLILQLMVLWELIRGGVADVEEIDTSGLLASIIHSIDGLEEALAGFEDRAAIAVPDAARVMHKKEAMSSEVVELEKDFLDVRTNEYLILLGYQEWDAVPDFLQRRRAKGAFFIPTRGTVRGYNRESLDHRYDEEEWPTADLVDSFPSLEGSDLWSEYKRMDKRAKSERMDAQSEGEDADEGVTVREVVEDIEQRGLGDFVLTHNQNGRAYIDADLIEYEYGVSARKAKQVKKVLERDHDVDEQYAEAGA